MLSVRDLSVSLGPETAPIDIVSGVSFSIGKREILGLVGESGCGKSITSLAVMGLLPQPGPRIRTGQITLAGADVTQLQPWQRVEAGHGHIAMIFQEPMTSLNPVRRVGDQIAEAVRVHDGVSGAAALARARELLDMVRIPDAALQLSAYPHQLSGGQRQRIMIAIALACRPQVLIADEPTTALDVTIQIQILGLLRDLCNRLGMSILFITHDMGVIAQLVDRVAVMYAGRIVETAAVACAVRSARSSLYPRADGLHAGAKLGRPSPADDTRTGTATRDDCRRLCFRATLRRRARGVPRGDAAAPSRVRGARNALRLPARRWEPGMNRDAILDVRDLKTSFNVKRSGRKYRVQAVDGVSLSLAEGEVLGIVGESGCGKTTVGRSIVRLVQPDSGTINFKGTDVLAARGSTLRELRLNIRMVFQDPYASLNPRRSIGDSVAEAGDINGVFKSRAERTAQITSTLTSVGLDPSFAERYPHELSGGQRQRAGIARAILPTPAVIIADEPVSALDVSVQAQVLNLMMDLREQLKLSMLFISHDLGVIGQISDRVAVMYMGRIVELADTRTILERPLHPYTQALMLAVPRPDPTKRIAGAIETGEPPSQFNRPIGCAYAARCPMANSRCLAEIPLLRPFGQNNRMIACHNL